MTDQQTSRTNITEALRLALTSWVTKAAFVPRRLDATDDALYQAANDWLAAEPRSDALTAPDEPHRDYAGRTCTTGLMHAHAAPDEPSGVVSFATDEQFWRDWWRNWFLYGTVYAINNPNPRIIPAESLTVHEGPCEARAASEQER